MVKIYKSVWIIGMLFLFVVGIFSFPSRNIVEADANTPKIQTPIQTIASPAKPAIKIEQKQPAPPLGLSLSIPAIGLEISLGQTYLDSQGHLMVPANPQTAAWYATGPKPGEAGTTLITGHLDSAAGPGIFYNLNKLKQNDGIKVGLANGSTATYKVEKLVSFPQDNSFPWNEVYSTSGSSQLRIITCDGIYNSKTKHYNRNLVVYASLVSID